MVAGWSPSEAGRQLSGLCTRSRYSPSSACRRFCNTRQAGCPPKKQTPGMQRRAGGTEGWRACWGARAEVQLSCGGTRGGRGCGSQPSSAHRHWPGGTLPSCGCLGGHVPGLQNSGPGQNSFIVVFFLNCAITRRYSFKKRKLGWRRKCHFFGLSYLCFSSNSSTITFCFCQAAKAALHLLLCSVGAVSLPSKESESGLQRVNKQQELWKELHLMWSQAACSDRTAQPVTGCFVLETYGMDWSVDETTARHFRLAGIWEEMRDKSAASKCICGWLENSRYTQLHFWCSESTADMVWKKQPLHFLSNHDLSPNEKALFWPCASKMPKF